MDDMLDDMDNTDNMLDNIDNMSGKMDNMLDIMNDKPFSGPWVPGGDDDLECQVGLDCLVCSCERIDYVRWIHESWNLPT